MACRVLGRRAGARRPGTLVCLRSRARRPAEPTSKECDVPVAPDKRNVAPSVRPMLSAVVLAHQTDQRLLALAAQGHEQAFAMIFQRYQRELQAHAARIVRAERSDDVVQHAMLAAWSAISPDAQIADVRAWLHRITHNAALDAISRRGYGDQALPDTVQDRRTPHAEVETRQMLRHTLVAITDLPEAQREALTLTAFDGHNGREGAARMGVSESAFRQLVHRARSRLRSSVSAVTPMPLLIWATGPASVSTVAATGTPAGASLMIAKIAATVAVAGVGVGVTPHITHVARDTHAARTVHRAPPRTAITGTAAAATPLSAAAVVSPVQRRRRARRGTPRSPVRANMSGGQHDAAAPDTRPSDAPTRHGASARRDDTDDQASPAGRSPEQIDDPPVVNAQQSARPASDVGDSRTPADDGSDDLGTGP